MKYLKDIKQALSKNQQGYKSVLSEMWESPEIARWQEQPFSPSSLCEARQKLPENIFTELNKALVEPGRIHAAANVVWASHFCC